jgi:hypothetical protein
MTEFITNFLKHLGCSHCQEFEFQNTKNNENLKDWKLFLKEYEMYSAMFLYNENLKKDISYIINKNESVFLVKENNDIFLKLEYISNNEKDNISILVPTDEYQNIYENIESMEKVFNKDMNAYYIGTYNIKKSKNSL